MWGAVLNVHGRGDSVFPESVAHARMVEHGSPRFHNRAVPLFCATVLHWCVQGGELSADPLIAEVTCEFASSEFTSLVEPRIPQRVSEGVSDVRVKILECGVCLTLGFEVIREVRACVIVDDDHKVPVPLYRFRLHRSTKVDMDEFEWCGSTML